MGVGGGRDAPAALDSLHHGDDRGARGDVVSRNAGDVGVVEPVGHQDRGDLRVARLVDDGGIKDDQGLTGADVIAGLDLDVESLAAQLDGVDTDVDEQFDARIELEPEGVAGLWSGDDGGVGRADDRAVTGLDGDAVTDDAGGEDRVGNLGDRNRTPLERGGDGDGLGCDLRGRGGFDSLNRGSFRLGFGGNRGGSPNGRSGSRGGGESRRSRTMTRAMAVKKEAAMATAYRPILSKAGIVSKEVKTKAGVCRPPPAPMMTPPTRQPTSMDR